MIEEIQSALDRCDLIQAGGNQPFLLEDGHAWVVGSGRVDLFAVRVADGEAVGPRRHLFRVQAGSALFGGPMLPLPPAEGAEAGLTILAVGHAGTTVRRISLSLLASRSGEGGWAEQIREWLAAWCAGLASALAPGGVPRAARALEAGLEPVLNPGDLLAGGEGLVWVRPLDGECLFLGERPLAPGDALPVPLSATTWVRAGDEGCRLEVLDATAALVDGAIWAWVAALHREALERVQAALDGEARQAQEQVERREALGHHAMVRALAGLATVMEPVEPGAAAASVVDDPLLLACQHVGGAMGVTIAPSPEMRAGRRAKDPLNAIARASHVRVRRVLLRPGWWHRDHGPLLAFREADQHPVAILPRGPLRYEMVDSAEGARVPVTAGLAAALSPQAYVFYTPLPRRALRAFDLLRQGLRAGESRDRRAVLLMGALVGLLGLAAPVALGVVMDTILPDADRGQLVQMGLILVAMAAATTLFQLTRGLAVLRVETRMTASVQAGLWDRLLSLPVPFFRQFSSGDLALRSLGVDAIRQALTGAALSSLLSAAFSVFSLVVLFAYDAGLALVALVLVGLAVLFTLVTEGVQVRYEQAVQHLDGRISALVLQLITGIAKLRVAAAEERAFASWAGEFAEKKRLAFRARATGNILTTFNGVFPIFALMVIFAMAAGALREPAGQGGLTTGAFLAFNAAFAQFLAAAMEMSSVLTTVLRIVPVYQRAQPILAAAPEVQENPADPGELAGDIEVSHVTFRYTPGGPVILDDVSLRVRPGEFVAIVGPSGSGKSTLLRLLLGFEKPESGTIYYDGQVLDSLDVQAVRRRMGIVLQNGQVLPGSLFENIVGSSPLTVDDAMAAARTAGLDRDIEGMPMGIHTVIGVGGGTLSGGQRQRLLIARAVVNQPKILLFDEATSALDNRTQASVSRSLEELKASRLVVAHRLSTIVNADRIYVMQAGRVVQSGKYEELLAQPGPFADLARPQML